jgi:hypothetical protein
MSGQRKRKKGKPHAIDNVMEELRLEKELREKNVAAGTVTPPWWVYSYMRLSVHSTRHHMK